MKTLTNKNTIKVITKKVILFERALLKRMTDYYFNNIDEMKTEHVAIFKSTITAARFMLEDELDTLYNKLK